MAHATDEAMHSGEARTIYPPFPCRLASGFAPRSDLHANRQPSWSDGIEGKGQRASVMRPPTSAVDRRAAAWNYRFGGEGTSRCDLQRSGVLSAKAVQMAVALGAG